MIFKTAPFCLLSVIAFIFAGCVEVEDGGPVESEGYQSGFEKGRSDGTEGLSRTPDRHSALYAESNREEFFRGYEDGYTQGIRPGADVGGDSAGASFGQPLTAEVKTGKVTIKEGSQTVSELTTALPNVEETRFIEEQNKIVVKTRGKHGPATVQLFDSRSGAELESIQAFEIKDGQPVWGAGMED